MAFAAHGKPLGWCEMLKKIPVAVFKGWHALQMGEFKGLDVRTSGGWLSQYAVCRVHTATGSPQLSCLRAPLGP